MHGSTHFTAVAAEMPHVTYVLTQEQQAWVDKIVSRARLLGEDRHRMIAARYARRAAECLAQGEDIEQAIAAFEKIVELRLQWDARDRERMLEPFEYAWFMFKLLAAYKAITIPMVMVAVGFVPDNPMEYFWMCSAAIGICVLHLIWACGAYLVRRREAARSRLRYCY